MKKEKYYLDPTSKIIFSLDKDGVYYPVFMNCDEEAGTGEVISSNILYREFVEFVIFMRRQQDKKTGKYYSLPLFPYQWSCLLLTLEALIQPEAQQFLWALSRQAGKTTMYQLLVPFALTMIPKYIDVDTLRFTVILGSYVEDKGIKELYKKVKPEIIKAIEYYNKRNKDTLLCKALDARLRLMDNAQLLEIDKQFPNGDCIPYSQIRNIACSSPADGFTSNLSCIDEVGLIDANLYKTSMANYTSATAGISVYSGVPNQDSSSLFYDKKKDKSVDVLLYDYPLVRVQKFLISDKLGKAYESDYRNKVSGTSGGEKSSFIRWNYYLDTEDSNGKFMSKTALEKNKILVNSIGEPLVVNDRTYICAGIDVSASGDYKVVTVGETKISDSFDYDSQIKIKKYDSNVRDILSLNKDGKQQSGEEFARLSVEFCMKYKVDCVAIDSSSAGGKIFTQLFRKYMLLNNVKFMILPFAYNQNKQYLIGSLENAIYSTTIHLLKEDESWESSKLVEEMCYMQKKHVNGSTYIKYEAPKGEGFTDDHVNSVALFNICAKEIYERSINKKRRVAEDGSGARWSLHLAKFKGEVDYKLSPKDSLQNRVNCLWGNVPL